MDLKPEHRIFAEQYVIDWNGTRSYKVAYPKVGDNTAAVNAIKLLSNTKISEYIEEIQQDMAKLSGLSMLSNLNELKAILTKGKEHTKDKIRAIEVINKMLDFNSPEKSERVLKDETKTPEELEKEIALWIKKAQE